MVTVQLKVDFNIPEKWMFSNSRAVITKVIANSPIPIL